jgi:dTDP-4-dehydrorhamnose reductase
MRVLVTGAGGQLGTDVVALCRSRGDEVIAADRSMLDISNRSAVHALLSTARPDAVINCAAWTTVDACESDPDRAWLHNALAVRWLREGCELTGSHLVQISTDYVFDGTKADPYTEWDQPNPTSIYGQSKLGGEREAGPSATIVRTSWVVGEHGSNMVKTILRLAAERPSLAFVSDQRGCPTFTADLAVMLRRLAVERRSGLHHVTNQGAMSWFEFARLVVAAAGRDPEIVSPIATVDLQPARPAPRPANSVLDNAALRLQGIDLLPSVQESLAVVVRRLQESVA